MESVTNRTNLTSQAFCATSPSSFSRADNMGQVTTRTSENTKGCMGISPWNGNSNPYTFLAINLGNNFISSLEIVSSLNCFNLANRLYHFNYINCIEKYNPKVYIGAVQTAASIWNYDSQDPTKVDPKWVSNGTEKSGSRSKICNIQTI